MRGLLMISGESFREGAQNSRQKGTEKSVKDQMLAAESHSQFVKQAANRGIKFDVAISTYDTQYAERLKSFYGLLKDDKTIGSFEFNTSYSMKSQQRLFNELLVNFDESYDFMLWFRIDLFLKPEFSGVFDPEWKRIKAPFVCWKILPGLKHYHAVPRPRVADTMLFVPAKLRHVVTSPAFELSHGMWGVYNSTWAKEIESHDYHKGMGVMIDTLHDSDSAKDWNPLYRIVNRPESETWYSEGSSAQKLFPKYIKMVPTPSKRNGSCGRFDAARFDA